MPAGPAPPCGRSRSATAACGEAARVVGGPAAPPVRGGSVPTAGEGRRRGRGGGSGPEAAGSAARARWSAFAGEGRGAPAPVGRAGAAVETGIRARLPAPPAGGSGAAAAVATARVAGPQVGPPAGAIRRNVPPVVRTSGGVAGSSAVGRSRDRPGRAGESRGLDGGRGAGRSGVRRGTRSRRRPSRSRRVSPDRCRTRVGRMDGGGGIPATGRGPPPPQGVRPVGPDARLWDSGSPRRGGRVWERCPMRRACTVHPRTSRAGRCGAVPRSARRVRAARARSRPVVRGPPGGRVPAGSDGLRSASTAGLTGKVLLRPRVRGGRRVAGRPFSGRARSRVCARAARPEDRPDGAGAWVDHPACWGHGVVPADGSDRARDAAAARGRPRGGIGWKRARGVREPAPPSLGAIAAGVGGERCGPGTVIRAGGVPDPAGMIGTSAPAVRTAEAAAAPARVQERSGRALRSAPREGASRADTGAEGASPIRAGGCAALGSIAAGSPGTACGKGGHGRSAGASRSVDRSGAHRRKVCTPAGAGPGHRASGFAARSDGGAPSGAAAGAGLGGGCTCVRPHHAFG
ncbi:hypothetical protein HRbin39_00471 [bacterium HR39]|nr:hypothetical protein HRbin39_00471 [bacterium HR39]